MEKEEKTSDCCKKDLFKCHHGSGSNAIYGLGIIGALFYFLQSANNFNMVVVGIIKSVFWPAVVLFKVLTDLHL